MARRGAAVLLALLASASFSHFAAGFGSSELHGAIRQQLAQDEQDQSQSLQSSSTRRLLQSEQTVPITEAHTVALPETADLAGVMSGLANIASGSTMGMFPASLFPQLSGNSYGFAPNNNSFCLFHVPKAGGKTPSMPYSAPGSYAYGSSAGKYGGGFNGYIPASYSAYGGSYNVVDLTGPTPNPTFPYGLPQPLADLISLLGAELDCLLAPILGDQVPNFAVFIEVLFEDATALLGEFVKLVQSGYLAGKAPANTEEIIYLRNPIDPWGPPLKYSFALDSLAASFGVDNTIIPPVPAQAPYSYDEPSYASSWTPTTETGFSPAASALADSIGKGSDIFGVGYDGYLDQCSVILGSVPDAAGSFDKVNDFTASINDGAWSVPLSTLLNETGDVAFVVPASRSGDYAQLTESDRASAGYCYDMATLLPMYNPLACPIPSYIDPNTTSISATALSTLLVFGEAFGLNQPTLKTALGITQDTDLLTLDALDGAMKEPEGEAAWVYKSSIEVQNVVTVIASVLCNDSSTYASFAVLADQAIARAALSATVQDATNGYNVTGPALDLTNAQVVQDLIYGARAWISTTSDTSLPQSLASLDARQIYAAAYAAANINVATTQAANATDVQKTAYYTQGTAVPSIEDMVDGTTSVDSFMNDYSIESVSSALASTELPGSLTPTEVLGSPASGSGASETQSASTTSSRGKKLSGGDIAGIVIGCVVGVALLAAAAGIALRSRSSRRSASRV